MCGIAGVIGSNDQVDAEERVLAMVSALARRGPDGVGIETWSEAVLGHRRLAIFDTSPAGHQPMILSDRALGVVFNGAIYNFLDLRNQLEVFGYRFNSRTDTEVLLHGYRQWGIQGLVSKLRGMFAFGLWDDEQRKLFLVRDRLGVKPLVYIIQGRRLAFASTVRALRAASFVDGIDPTAVAEFLEFGFVTDERSIYQNARKLPAANILEWTNGEIRLLEYWKPPTASESLKIQLSEAVEETERLFLQAVKRRLQADVPVGALLSGGIDSSLVCWAIHELGADINAFSIGVPGDPWDESSEAAATAQRLAVRHRILEMSPNNSLDFRELIDAFAEPFACASALGMLRLSSAVSNSATVLLTGDGGDDVFLGYPEHRHLWLAQKLARILPKRLAVLWNTGQPPMTNLGLLKRGFSFLSYITGGLGAVVANHDGLPFYEANGLLGDRLSSIHLAQRRIKWSAESGRRVLGDFLCYDRATRFVGEYLTKVDGATMHYALEARSPFLDQDLWEFAAALPFDLRLHNGRLKAILRRLAFQKLGRDIANRPKRGFGVPVQRWLVEEWLETVQDVFRNSLLVEEKWIESAALNETLRRAVHIGRAPNQLWYIFVLELWLRHERKRALALPPNHFQEHVRLVPFVLDNN